MSKPTSKTRAMLNAMTTAYGDARRFFQDELWDVNLATLPRMRKLLFAGVRVVHMVVKGFAVDLCNLQASALTYFTLMAMVPVLALMFSVSKGLRVQDRLMGTAGLQFDPTLGEILVSPESKLAALPAEFIHGIESVLTMVENTNFSTLGLIGVVLLFWAVVKMMGRIETTFNIIWGVRKSRTLIRKFADYISVLVTFPIMLLLATSANAALNSERLTSLLQLRLGPLFWVYQRGLGLTSVVFVVLGFSLLYMFMPNTKVNVFPAALGGLLTGLLFLAWQWFYFTVQVGAAKNNPIYGTFAAIPLFLVYVQVCWLLVLFGAEVSFALQNYRTYQLESSPKTLAFATQQLLGVLFVQEICREFHAGRTWNASRFAVDHNIPSRLASTVLASLVEHAVIVKVEGKTDHYVPGRDTSLLTLAHVRLALRGEPLRNVSKALAERCPKLEARLQELETATQAAMADQPFAQFVAEG